MRGLPFHKKKKREKKTVCTLPYGLVWANFSFVVVVSVVCVCACVCVCVCVCVPGLIMFDRLIHWVFSCLFCTVVSKGL